MINGSRRESGCTYTALGIVAEELRKNGIDSKILYIGDKVLDGRIDETVRQAADMMKDADALVVGSPVYYASPSGEIVAFMDRFFAAAGKDLMYKPAAAVCSARRAGTTATLDDLNKYFSFNRMPIISSSYWNMVHGNTPEDVRKDEEGCQIMRHLGENMAWILKSIEAGKKSGVTQPSGEPKVFTNFI